MCQSAHPELAQMSVSSVASTSPRQSGLSIIYQRQSLHKTYGNRTNWATGVWLSSVDIGSTEKFRGGSRRATLLTTIRSLSNAGLISEAGGSARRTVGIIFSRQTPSSSSYNGPCIQSEVDRGSLSASQSCQGRQQNDTLGYHFQIIIEQFLCKFYWRVLSGRRFRS